MEESLILIVLGGSAMLGLLVTVIEMVRHVRRLGKQRRQYEMMRHSLQLSAVKQLSNDVLHQQRLTNLEHRLAYVEHYLAQTERLHLYDVKRRAAEVYGQ